jgi:hypothetical protein
MPAVRVSAGFDILKPWLLPWQLKGKSSTRCWRNTYAWPFRGQVSTCILYLLRMPGIRVWVFFVFCFRFFCFFNYLLLVLLLLLLLDS